MTRTKTMTEKALAANRTNGKQGGRRPSAITPEQREEIYEAIRAGVPPETAAGRIGVARRSLYDWLARGREDGSREPYRSFTAEVDKALAGWETRDILLIGKAAETQWQAAAWRLERRKPQEYGRRTRVEGQVTITARPFVDIAKLSIDEQRQLRALLQKAQPDAEELPDDARSALELMPGPPVESAAA